MQLLPPVGWADVATKRDLDALEERMDLRFAALEERMGAMIHASEARLFRWFIPTMLTGLALAAGIARF